MTTRNPPWSEAENKALVALYFAMLDMATTGQQYNKAAMIRDWQNAPATEKFPPAPLGGRSKGSIEAKLMNATAAHQSLTDPTKGSLVTMHEHGYRALRNYQASLKDAMADAIRQRNIDPHDAMANGFKWATGYSK